MFARIASRRSRAGQSHATRRLNRATGDVIEQLERRTMLSTNVLSYHNDAASDGVDSTETLLTPGNVNVADFGKNFTTAVDGQIYAQPLFESNLSITANGATTTHDVVFVATQHDSLYAIDADGGTVLWQDSFLSLSTPGAALPGATSISTVPNTDLNSTDINPEVGITSTPVIDAVSQSIYVVAKTSQQVALSASNKVATHYAQTLFRIDTHTGKVIDSTVIGEVSFANNAYTYYSGPSVPGTGAGAQVVNGKSVVTFNALRGLNRSALEIENGSVVVAFASHGDNGPYHGWVLAYDETSLAPTAVFNDDPNGSDGGYWEGGDGVVSDADGNLYLSAGNGSFNTAASNFNAAGFPIDGDYGDCVIKLSFDSTTTAANPGVDGWGFKVDDYFSPYNNAALNSSDRDLGAGGITILPDSAGSSAHPHLLVTAGKEGTIYLIDRDNMGKFNSATDHVVQEQTNALNGSLSTPAFFNGTLYWVSAYGDYGKAFSIANGVMSTKPIGETPDKFNFTGSSPSISANGTTNGIIWNVDRSTAQVRAYDATNYNKELWTSAQDPQRDGITSITKFAVPTVANGRVYVGTLNALVVYGPPAPAAVAPAAPSGLAASAASGIQINLSWTDNSNNESGFEIDQSSDGGKTFTKIGTTGVNVNTFAANNLQVSTAYSFRVSAFNTVGASGYSNVATATTTATPPAVNFASGFASASGMLQFNGKAAIADSALAITDGGANEANSAFTKVKVDVTKFSTAFTFQLVSGSADGFAFVLQNQGATAVGALGPGLGYQNITPSVAIKFDLANNNGEGTNSTGVYTDGALPTKPYISLANSGVDLHSGTVLTDVISYDGTTLTNTITDPTTSISVTQKYTVNLPSVLGGSTAYVGFTGGTNTTSAVQHILTWTYNATPSTAPAAPTNLTAVAASGTQVTLAWNDSSSNEAGFKIYRSTDGSTFTEVTTVGANIVTYNDTQLLPNTHYYYKVSATNAVGDSAFTNVADLVTPVPPPTPTHVIAQSVTPTTVSLSWTNNATNDTGYKVLREASTQTEFSQIGNLAADSTSFVDTTAQPGVNYDYHIQCFNAAGYSDFAGINLSTPMNAPVLQVSTTGGAIVLSWTADASAASFNVYRSTTAGGEGTTPYKTGITTSSFTDAAATLGTNYFYTVKAENEFVISPTSNEVSATANAPVTSGSVSGTVLTSAGNVVAGVSVYLDANNNAKLDSGEQSMAVGASGAYSFTSVPSGTYVIRQILPAGDTQTTPASNNGIAVTVTAGGNLTNENFIDTAPAVVTSGTVSGSVKTSTGAAVVGATVYLDANGNAALDAGESSTVTDSTGAYSFANVKAGSYVVRQVVPTGDTQTTPAGGGGIAVTVVSGGAIANQNFVDTATVVATGGSVSGSIKTAAGKAVSGVTVYLDINNNSKLDTGELSTTTDASGAYAFSKVPAGAYIVRQLLPTGDTQTTPASNYGLHVTVANGAPVANQNFVDTLPAVATDGSVSGFVKTSAGKAVAGVIVYLDANNNSHLDAGELSTVTRSTGAYTFTNVPAGAYVVRQVLANGYTQAAPAGNYGDHVTVTKTSVATNQNFTDTVPVTGTAIIAGAVFNDVNSNGKQDVGEAGLAGVALYIDEGNSLSYVTGDPTVTTDASGNYTFDDLVAGAYIIRVTGLTGYKQTTPANGLGQHVTVAAGKKLSNAMFGETRIA